MYAHAMQGAGEGNVVPLKGKPVFPPLCANCGAAAHARLTVARAFGHGDGSRVVSYRPFFCDGCIAVHRGELKPDATILFRRLVSRWQLWIPVLGSGWACSVALPGLFDSLLRRDGAGVLMSGALVVFFALIALGCMAAIWMGSRHLAVRKPTSVTSAVQFTDDLSQTFEPSWRRFTFRNAEYAERFREKNEERLWSRSRPEAQRAMVMRHYGKYLLYLLLALLAVFAIADEFGISLWDMFVNAL